ncbi:class I SAM-dependent methyltransferase [Bosea sp. (in: a-proteobacteria)]|uniref:class I SAM-dependent methyltransferase n=1 Tax=Bosea sp. (in: a-proteobacteria) TaxID=1871050 RepID=UPI0026295011|nr:class I SAM-dependent methyltransferase [Bosea sp. (in: a-proteobacteria)]MCO5091030.1 class I SAM-dependent methyltransferase [Bosea sp. (in: a-proteobacteria)]
MTPDSMDAVAKVARDVGYRSADRYQARCKFLFDGVRLTGARVLDVGCGRGALALWAGLHGASHVLGIEPESDGSTQGMLSSFQGTIDKLGLGPVVKSRACFLEDITPSDGCFDVVVLFNVINHLDEKAVTSLHTSKDSAESYTKVLRHLRTIVADGGSVIVADCGRRNFWNDIGLRNPLMPTIEWHKHQQPKLWASIFEGAGFALHDLRWSPLYPLGAITSNWPVHYFTASHFTLRFKAV